MAYRSRVNTNITLSLTIWLTLTQTLISTGILCKNRCKPQTNCKRNKLCWFCILNVSWISGKKLRWFPLGESHKNPRWPPKNMENQKYLPNYKSFWYAQRTKVVYQVKLHKHAKFENHTLKNSRVTPLQKTRKMVKFMFFSNNFLTTKYFITTKEQIRWRIAFYIKI